MLETAKRKGFHGYNETYLDVMLSDKLTFLVSSFVLLSLSFSHYILTSFNRRIEKVF
jgi:hypothetical protein